MSAASPPLDRWNRTAPFGARFRDVATNRYVTDGLRLRAFRSGDLRRRPALGTVNRSGVYHLHDLPGLREAEAGDGDDAYWAAVGKVAYRIVVDDPANRYLPFSIDVALPVRGLFGYSDDASPPQRPSDIPLFSTSARAAPDLYAVIRAELRESTSGDPAAWALLKASVDGDDVAIGMADGLGRVALVFPYPAPARPPLTSPPPAVAESTWNIGLTAFYLRQDPVPDAPELGLVFAQLAHPRRLLESLSPPVVLDEQLLAYRRETVVRSFEALDPPSPYLFIEAA